MVKPAPFSRLQLAAALIGEDVFTPNKILRALIPCPEYDNDPANPNVPFRSAEDSAIFAHLRRSGPRRSKDYLGVTVPSEVESEPGQRRSRGSLGALRNPFESAEDDNDDDDDDDEPPGNDGLEVDLTSWGLDAFVEKDKKNKGKGKARSQELPNPYTAPSLGQTRSVAGETARSRGARSMSVGTLNDFGVGGAFLEAEHGNGSDSFGRIRSSVDLDRMQLAQPLSQRRASAHALIENLPVQLPLHSVPFPSIRSRSPGQEEALRPTSLYLDLQGDHTQNRLSATLDSKTLLKGFTDDGGGQPAVVHSPTADQASRMDPVTDHRRTASNASMGSLASKNVLADGNPFTVRAPSPSRSSRFDPKVRTQSMSTEPMDARAFVDEVEVESSRDRPYSTVELLRPKVLVMPSPLQSVALPQTPQVDMRPRSGFVTSTDGPPLPPGARSARLSSQVELASAPVASNSFTPNPRASLTLSQLAFRNALVVGGQRDISYADIDSRLPRAAQEGEQVKFEIEEEAPEESPPPVSIPLPPVPPPTEIELKRPPGKLYGWSLIDNLDHRKAEMKQKARYVTLLLTFSTLTLHLNCRVFRGDDRPSMMIRGQIRRSGTLIDPATLGRPPSQNLETATSGLARRNSSGPLVDLNGEKPPALGTSAPEGKLPQSRSVFGVDTIWDREMIKLKEMEALEKAEAEERRLREQEEDGRRSKKKKKVKSKAKAKRDSASPSVEPGPSSGILEPHTSHFSPPLPEIRKPTLSRPPVHKSESDADGEDDLPLGQILSKTAVVNAGSIDGPRRTTGVGPRYPTKSQVPYNINGGDDSEEDIPLVAATALAAQRASRIPRDDDDEDEDKPLAAVLNEGKLLIPDNLATRSRSLKDDDDDDDKPLGLRASRVPMASQASAGSDDDKPLAFHPEQQRRTQYQMLAQMQQQQQQHMLMQAQMQNNIYFGAPAMMGSGFFGAPMAPQPMMMGVPMTMPIPPPSPPPAQDPAKFGRVDRWRHDVAVEGSE